MSDFAAGHIRRDPVSASVAVRTVFSEVEFPDMAWLVATTNFGAKNVASSYVEGWDDLLVPDADG